MRLLVTIPHFCQRAPAGGGFYGSERDGAELRAAVVGRCITALHQTFGRQQALFGPSMMPCNAAFAADLEVLLVTSGDAHLAPLLPGPLFRQAPVQADPRHLGFACHHIMRQRAADYDWFVYLEDDIEVTDPLLFAKLQWFIDRFGPSALLQPNRYEVADGLSVLKLYIDSDMALPGMSAPFQDVTVRPRLEADVFGRAMVFRRVENPHAGCFFLSAQQLGRMALSPQFGTPTGAFVGPLESAATLMIMRTFDVYKPARDNAGFFEVRHLGRRFLFDNSPSDNNPS